MWLCSLPNHTELLESVGQVSGFSYPQRLGMALRSAQGPGEGCWLALAVMFLPESWTPGPTKPPLMLHEKLVGYKTPTHSGQWLLVLLPRRCLPCFHSVTERGSFSHTPQSLLDLQERHGADPAQLKCIIGHLPWKLTAASQTWGRTQ